MPDKKITNPMPAGIQNDNIENSLDLKIAHRKPSSTPTMGLIEYTPRHTAGIKIEEYATGGVIICDNTDLV